MTSCRATPDGYLTDQHFDGCADPKCRGCYPCVPVSEHGDPLTHCTARRNCSHHIDTDHRTCPRCIARTRDTLTDLATLATHMPREAIVKGVNSEAAMLAGPAPDTHDDIAAYGHRQSSIAMGRKDGVVETTGRHALNVLGTWEQMLREDYHQPGHGTITVTTAVDYLNTQLDRFAQDPDQDLPQFVRDTTSCRAHYQAVLHDHNQGDRAGVGCFDCGGQLERKLTSRGFADHWTCRECGRRYTDPEYNFALRAALEGRTA